MSRSVLSPAWPHVVEQVTEEGPLRHHLAHHVTAVLLKPAASRCRSRTTRANVAALRPSPNTTECQARGTPLPPARRDRAEPMHAFEHVEGVDARKYSKNPPRLSGALPKTSSRYA